MKNDNNQLIFFDSSDKIKHQESIPGEEEIKEYIVNMIRKRIQPSASELLERLEDRFGWQVRHCIKLIISGLRVNPDVEKYNREYFRTVLSDDELNAALFGESKKSKSHKGTIEDLFVRSRKYRKSSAFKEMVEFISKFRDYAPYNNMLVKIQNPSCSFFATEKDWYDRFKRHVKEDAKPMLILAPMHPIMLVYDLDSTEGPPLPEQILSFGITTGTWDDIAMEHTLGNAERDMIDVKFKELSSTMGGFATTRLHNNKNKMRIVVHDKYDVMNRYSVLCHELAHIYLGHLGGDKDGWWPCRQNLSNQSVEIEAESVAYIVSTRVGLLPPSAEYLSSYFKEDYIPETVSIELIAKVAARIEEMGKRLLPKRKITAHEDRLFLD